MSNFWDQLFGTPRGLPLTYGDVMQHSPRSLHAMLLQSDMEAMIGRHGSGGARAEIRAEQRLFGREMEQIARTRKRLGRLPTRHELVDAVQRKGLGVPAAVRFCAALHAMGGE